MPLLTVVLFYTASLIFFATKDMWMPTIGDETTNFPFLYDHK